MKMNPKHIRAMKDGKVPMEYIVWEMLALDARVHKHGADKYGVRNWRRDRILASTYEGAMLRHLSAWAMGEDIDPDSGMHHLAHLRACCAVVIDADAHGTMLDNRDRLESISANTRRVRRVLPKISRKPKGKEGARRAKPRTPHRRKERARP